LCVTLGAPPVAAEPANAAGVASSEELFPFRVDYRAGPGCPPIDHFFYQLRARTRRLIPARPGDPALTFVVQVTDTAEGTQGELSVVEPNGAQTVRSVPGTHCIEVLDAMALIAAVFVDPAASLAPVPPRPPDPPAPPPGALEVTPPPPPVRRRVVIGLGVGPTLKSGIAPDASFGAEAHVEVISEGASLWEPYARLGVHGSRSGTAEVPDSAPTELRRGEARFTWFAAKLLGCPVVGRFPLLRLRPCATAEFGVLRGEGFGVPAATAKSLPWFALGLSGTAELVLSDTWVVALDASAAAPLRRSDFYFAPKYGGDDAASIHEISAVTFQLGVLFGVRFF
jgi:hypothetical protein